MTSRRSPSNLQNEGTLDWAPCSPGITDLTGSEDGCVVDDSSMMQGFDWARVEGVVDPDCWNTHSEGDLVKYLTSPIKTPSGAVKALPASGEVRLGALMAEESGDYVVRVKFDDTGLDTKWEVDQQNDAPGRRRVDHPGVRPRAVLTPSPVALAREATHG